MKTIRNSIYILLAVALLSMTAVALGSDHKKDGDCTRVNPGVGLNPVTLISTGSVPQTTIVNVTNLDSGHCGSSSFEMSSFLPAGWTSTFSQSIFSLSPGQEKFINLTITPKVNETAGLYNYTASAIRLNVDGKGSATGLFLIN